MVKRLRDDPRSCVLQIHKHPSTIQLGHHTAQRLWHLTHDTYLLCSSGCLECISMELTTIQVLAYKHSPRYWLTNTLQGIGLQTLSNYQSWCKDPYIVRPSSHLVWSIVGQESLNGYTSSFCMTPSCESVYTGIEITSGLFQVWHSSDIYSLRELEGGCMMTLISTMASIDLSIYLSNRVGVTS